MDLETVWKGLLITAVGLFAAFVLVQTGIAPSPFSEEKATVTVVDDDSETLATVDVEVADTWEERYTGLSEHDSLENGSGMLFVHSSEDERTYVMRNMSFDIDIIFIDSDGEITTIHHARAPEPGEDGEDLRYSGRAQWVLEVPRGYANETGIDVGDEVRIEYE